MIKILLYMIFLWLEVFCNDEVFNAAYSGIFFPKNTAKVLKNTNGGRMKVIVLFLYKLVPYARFFTFLILQFF